MEESSNDKDLLEQTQSTEVNLSLNERVIIREMCYG